MRLMVAPAIGNIPGAANHSVATPTAGRNVFYAAVFPSSLGEVFTLSDAEQLYLLAFNDQKNLPRQLQQFRQHFQPKLIRKSTAFQRKIAQSLQDYFHGEQSLQELPFLLWGTHFQVAVWRQLLRVQPGEVTTYQMLARQCGRPGAARAVGNAVGANHLAMVVPCHRVIAANGTLGGYAGGLERKKQLLETEKHSERKQNQAVGIEHL